MSNPYARFLTGSGTQAPVTTINGVVLAPPFMKSRFYVNGSAPKYQAFDDRKFDNARVGFLMLAYKDDLFDNDGVKCTSVLDYIPREVLTSKFCALGFPMSDPRALSSDAADRVTVTTIGIVSVYNTGDHVIQPMTPLGWRPPTYDSAKEAEKRRQLSSTSGGYLPPLIEPYDKIVEYATAHTDEFSVNPTEQPSLFRDLYYIGTAHSYGQKGAMFTMLFNRG